MAIRIDDAFGALCALRVFGMRLVIGAGSRHITELALKACRSGVIVERKKTAGCLLPRGDRSSFDLDICGVLDSMMFMTQLGFEAPSVKAECCWTVFHMTS